MFNYLTKALMRRGAHSSLSMRPLPDSVSDLGVRDVRQDLPDDVRPAAAKSIEIKHVEAKPAETKLKDPLSWPSDPFELMPYDEIAKPIKKIIDTAYKFSRTDKKSFEYEGYEIGQRELQYQSSPKYRFTESVLAFEKTKYGRNLIDVAMNVLYLLGVEQGRRAERQSHKPVKEMTDELNGYKKTTADMLYRIDELEAQVSALKQNPLATNDEVKAFVDARLKDTRADRLLKLKAQVVKNRFELHERSETAFKTMREMAEHIECTAEEWNGILEKHGWRAQDWAAACDKKSFKQTFANPKKT